MLAEVTVIGDCQLQTDEPVLKTPSTAHCNNITLLYKCCNKLQGNGTKQEVTCFVPFTVLHLDLWHPSADLLNAKPAVLLTFEKHNKAG